MLPGGVKVDKHEQRQGRGSGDAGEEGRAAVRHPHHGIPSCRLLPRLEHLPAGNGDLRVGLRGAVWRADGSTAAPRLRGLPAQCGGRPHSVSHGGGDCRLDHEHLLGHGHGHPGHLQDARRKGPFNASNHAGVIVGSTTSPPFPAAPHCVKTQKFHIPPQPGQGFK